MVAQAQLADPLTQFQSRADRACRVVFMSDGREPKARQHGHALVVHAEFANRVPALGQGSYARA